MSEAAEAKPIQKTTAVKATKTAGEVRKYVKLMNTRAQEYSAEGKPVAWVMYAPLHAPILPAFDMASIYTENYAGLCSAKKKEGLFINQAEGDGYANEICGYARIGLGHSALRKAGVDRAEFPDGGMADPTVFIGSSTGCDVRYKWYEVTHRYDPAPAYNWDDVCLAQNLRRDGRQVKEYAVKYQTDQLHKLVTFLETNLKQKLDWDYLREKIRMHNESYRLWYETYRLRRATPAPMPTQDGLSVMVPHMFLPAEQGTVDFYKQLRDEVKERVEQGKGVIENEKQRILWAGGLPPWHSMNIFNYFESKGAVFPMETAYYQGEPVEDTWDYPGDPLENWVRANFDRVLERTERAKDIGDAAVQQCRELIEEYKIDGLVYHGTKSCRAATIGQIHQTHCINKYIDIPTLVMQSDIVDARDYSEAQTHLRVDAFLETVDAQQRRRAAS